MKKHKVKIPEGYEFDQSFTVPTADGGMTATIEFKPIKKQLPKTWEEYLGKSTKCFPAINHLRVPLQYNEAFEALGKLIELRDHYNDGCSDDGCYSIINNKHNKIGKEMMISDSKRGPLSFIDGHRCEMFFSNFRDLIETAKPLL